MFVYTARRAVWLSLCIASELSVNGQWENTVVLIAQNSVVFKRSHISADTRAYAHSNVCGMHKDTRTHTHARVMRYIHARIHIQTHTRVRTHKYNCIRGWYRQKWKMRV